MAAHLPPPPPTSPSSAPASGASPRRWRLAADGAHGSCSTTAASPLRRVAAGMLCPWSEHEDDGEHELLRRPRAAAAAWPAFARPRSRSRRPAERLPPLRFRLRRRPPGAPRRRPPRPRHAGSATAATEDWQDADRLAAVEPGLGPAVTGGIALDDEHQADPSRAGDGAAGGGRARRRRARAGHRRDRERRPPGRRRRGHRRRRRERRRPCRRAPLATRAGAAREGPDPDAGAARRPPVAAARGWCARPPCYLVPRPDGRVVVGATQEERGDRDVTRRRRARSARRRAPDRHRSWRSCASPAPPPGCDPRPPTCGPRSARDADGLVWATGGFRHGVLLLPLAGAAIAAAAAGGRCPATPRRSIPRFEEAVDVIVNGREHELPAAPRCATRSPPPARGADERGVAVALDGTVVPRRPGTTTPLHERRGSRSCARRREDDHGRRPADHRRHRAALAAAARLRRLHRLDRFEAALAASGAEIVTVALRRVGAAPGGLYEAIERGGARVLPNTAGCFSAREAVLTAQPRARGVRDRLGQARGDRRPAHAAARRASSSCARARELVADGFVVLPYTTDDPVLGAPPRGRRLRGGDAARLADRLRPRHPQPARHRAPARGRLGAPDPRRRHRHGLRCRARDGARLRRRARGDGDLPGPRPGADGAGAAPRRRGRAARRAAPAASRRLHHAQASTADAGLPDLAPAVSDDGRGSRRRALPLRAGRDPRRAPRRPDPGARRRRGRHRAAPRPQPRPRRAAARGAGLRGGGRGSRAASSSSTTTPSWRAPRRRRRPPRPGRRRVADARAVLGADGLVGRTTRGGERSRARRPRAPTTRSVSPVWETPTQARTRPPIGLAPSPRPRARRGCRGSRSAASTRGASLRVAALGATRGSPSCARLRRRRPGRGGGRPPRAALARRPRVLTDRGLRLRRRRRHPGRHQGDRRAGGFPLVRGDGPDRADARSASTAVHRHAAGVRAGARSPRSAPISASTAIKTGMLGTPAMVEAVAAELDDARPGRRDPRGRRPGAARRGRLAADRARRRRRLPCATSSARATVITPNLFEAQALAGARRATTPSALARVLHERYGCAALVTGGHGADAPTTCSATARRPRGFPGSASPRRTTHGAGLHALGHAGRAARPRRAPAGGGGGGQGRGHGGRPARPPYGAGAGPVDVCGRCVA